MTRNIKRYDIKLIYGGGIIKITHHIPHEKEGKYYTVPFTVPENVVKITVSYNYFRTTKGFLADLKPSNTVDIGLMDEKGNFLGWSGSAHSTIFVGEFEASNGYLSKPINPGEWQIIVGAYHIMPGGVEVTYNIEFEYKSQVLLFGDLHIHSNASDGKFNAYELGAMAKGKHLDFIGLANHNNFAENLHLPHFDGLTFVPAVEWTHYNGHMNFFGISAPFENSFIANDKDEMQGIISHAKSLGAVISVNHPKCPICPYKWDDENAFDMMEIWNGPMRPSNKKAIEWWTSLLKQGRHIPIVGGSDYHRPRQLARLGNPVTAVYSESRGADDILDAIKNGNSFVTENADGIRLNLKYGGTVMGQTAKHSKEFPLEIYSNAKKVILVTDKGEKEITLTNGVAKITLEKVLFAYVKAVKRFGRLKRICAISNPIYFSQEVNKNEN